MARSLDGNQLTRAPRAIRKCTPIETTPTFSRETLQTAADTVWTTLKFNSSKFTLFFTFLLFFLWETCIKFKIPNWDSPFVFDGRLRF